ncbi:hypothetical protein MBLNU459_g0212t2 [Dothideomycetes sp. NU459]
MHPASLGNRLADIWGSGIYEQHLQTIRRGVKEGRAIQIKGMEFVSERNGILEESYHNFHLLPLVSPEGCVLGALNEYTEVTASVRQANRERVTARLIENAAKTEHLADLWSGFLAALEDESQDVTYGLLYSVPKSFHCDQPPPTSKVLLPENSNYVNASRQNLEFIGSYGIPDAALDKQTSNTLPEELAIQVSRGVVSSVCVLPITSSNGCQMAYAILGMNPRSRFDEGVTFLRSLRDLLSRTAALIHLPEELEEVNTALVAELNQLHLTRVKAEKNEETFTRMAKNAPIGMYMYDSDGHCRFVNDAYLGLINMEREEFMEKAETGLAWIDAIHEEDTQYVRETLRKLYQSKTSTVFQYRLKVPAGSDPRWVEATSFPEVDEDGNIVSIQGWLSDVSSRKLVESAMAERLQDAIETKRASERFIDMVSHEIRNPLSSILQLADGILTSLDSDADTPRSASPETVATIIDSAQIVTICAKHQQTIVNEVLTLSKLDSNLLVLAPEKVQPQSIVEQALKMFTAELSHADIKTEVNVRESYEEFGVDWVMLDPSRILQIIINLLTNAIKFTKDSDDRRITIDLIASETKPTADGCPVTLIEPRSRHSDTRPSSPTSSLPEITSAEDIYLSFVVKDTGCGLTESEMGFLFHRFSQASPKTYQQYGGSGLGLFISRELTELHGGQIGVASESGVGSTFAFYIKAQRLDSGLDTPRSNSVASSEATIAMLETPNSKTRILKRAHSSEKVKTSIKDLHILVVEDNLINQKVMAQQLRRTGCEQVHVADNGADALDFLSTTDFHAASRLGSAPLSIVLLDVEMPVMNGLDCVRRIRQLEASGEIVRHVPIIAITANARNEQIAMALEAGMDEVVSLVAHAFSVLQTKPFRIPELVPRMEALVEKWSHAHYHAG